MNRYGLTEREKAIWPPKAYKIDYSEEMSWNAFLGWMLFIVIVVSTTAYVHYVIEKKIPVVPVAHADVEKRSDRQQEIAYCKAWNKNQTQVSGATNMQIASHCESYL